MAIGTPTTIGTAASGGTASTSIALTTTAAVSVGDLIHVAIAANSNTAPTGVTDSAGNTYALDASGANGTTTGVFLYSAACTTALASGGTITLSGSSRHWAASATKTSGLATSGALDTTATNSGTGTALASGTTAATTQASELVLSVYAVPTATTTFTADTAGGFAALPSTSSASTVRYIFWQYEIVSSTGAQSAGGSLSASRAWAGAIATYKGAASDTTPPTLSSTSPANGATGVSISLASITATFSEAVTASAGHISVSGGVTGTLSGSGSSTLTFSITSGALAYSTTYTVTLSSSITDAAGNAYAGSTFSFTTEAAPVVASGALPTVACDDRLFVGVYGDVTLQSLLLDATPLADELEFSTGPHGFEACSLFYPMSVDQAWRLYDAPGTPHLLIRDRAGPVWAGRVEDRAVMVRRGETGVALTALGYSRALRDLPYTALWSTTSIADFRPVAASELTGRTPDRFAMTKNGNQLWLGLKLNTAYTNATIGQWTYETPPGSSTQITQIEFAYTQTLPNATWRTLVFAENRAFGSSSAVFTLNGNGSTQTGTWTATFTGVDRLSFLIQYNSAVATTNPDPDSVWWAAFSSIRLRAATTTNVATVGSHIAQVVNSVNPTQLSSSAALIQSPLGTDLTDRVYLDADMLTALAQLAQVGDAGVNTTPWEVGVADPVYRRLHVRPRASAGRTWYVDVVDTFQAQQTLDTLWNSVYAAYQTADQRRQISAVATDAGSIARYGLTRQQAVRDSTTSSIAANQRRDLALADGRTPAPRVAIGIAAIYDAFGHRWPSHLAQSGDTIVIRNLPPTLSSSTDRLRTFIITATRYRAPRDGAPTLEVTPEVPLPSLEQYVAALALGIG